MPHKLIDNGAPQEYIKRANAIKKLITQKTAAEEAMLQENQDLQKIAKDAHGEVSKVLVAERAAFLEWSHGNLAALHQNDFNETTYLYYDDKKGEPIRGGPVPDVTLTTSQLNRPALLLHCIGA